MASLREEMPQTAAWIDEVRALFCPTPAALADFNAKIKAGLEGQPGFYANENGREVGTQDRRQGVSPALPTQAELEAAEGARKATAEANAKGRGRA